MNEKKNDIWKKIRNITGAIMGIWAVAGLIFWIVGSQVFATREAVSILESKIVSKEIFGITLQRYEQGLIELKEEVKAQKKKMDEIYAILLEIRRNGRRLN